MAFFQPQRCILLTMFLVCWLGNTDAARSTCEKFNFPGACSFLRSTTIQTTIAPTVPSTGSVYCRKVCAYADAERDNDMCSCNSSTTTTTAMVSTTPKPETCYYTRHRKPQLVNRFRRLFDSTYVTPECTYPGIVGLFADSDPDVGPACAGLLVDEERILISLKCLTSLIEIDFPQVYALVKSYKLADVTRETFINITDPEPLNPGGQDPDNFYTVKLNIPVKFDGRCAEPACFPNDNIPADTINFDDCRLLGYGLLNNEFDVPSALTEIRVTVDRASIYNKYLTVTRVDQKPGMSCISDDTAPLVCTLKDNKAWVTVGATVLTGFQCNVPENPLPIVYNFLQECDDQKIYQGIQGLKYADPKNFPPRGQNDLTRLF